MCSSAIDAGMDSAGQDMIYGLEKAGKTLADVRAILLTHWHNDHAAGASVLQKATQAPVYCHPAELAALTRESAKTDWRGKLADAFAVVGGQLRFMSRPVTPDQASARRSMMHVFSCGVHYPTHFVAPFVWTRRILRGRPLLRQYSTQLIPM